MLSTVTLLEMEMGIAENAKSFGSKQYFAPSKLLSPWSVRK